MGNKNALRRGPRPAPSPCPGNACPAARRAAWSEFCAKVAALVCTTWGIKGKNLYLLNVLRKRLEYPALKRAVRDAQSLFHANVVLIEDRPQAPS